MPQEIDLTKIEAIIHNRGLNIRDEDREIAAKVTADIAVKFAKWIADNEFYTHNDTLFTSRTYRRPGELGDTYNSEKLFTEFLKTL